jgi:putative PEP-CTERM system histidine kinase
MVGLAADSALTAISLTQLLPEDLAYCQNQALGLKALVPVFWLCFSLSYSRGDFRESLRRWVPVVAIALLLPIVIVLQYRWDLIEVIPPSDSLPLFWLRYRTPAKALNATILLEMVLILMNLERTFRAAVGTMQWRIKFSILGLAVIFGARIYTRSQALVFSGHANSLSEVEVAGLLIGCLLLAIGYFRSGFAEIDVYPSRAVLHTSFTVLVVGGYLFFVGILAQIVAHTGGAAAFQIQAFLILIAIAVLALLLFSDRFRQKVRYFVSQHFKRPQYDFRQIWTSFTQSTSSAIDDSSLCAAAAKLISETFGVLSVGIWLFEDGRDRLVFRASTSRSPADTTNVSLKFPAGAMEKATSRKIVDLEKVKEEWGATLRDISGTQFNRGGNRSASRLVAGDWWLGYIILADRVAGAPYTSEELVLLECISDQVASSLLNLRLTQEIMLSKELEAFQTISAFFVHDLKNAASTLNLMLRNLPVHFDDPSFRADTLRGIGETTNRINQIIERLSSLRTKLELQQLEVDLNRLVEEAMQSFNGTSGVEFTKELQPIPKLIGDVEQLRSVVTNLLLNARDAVGENGHIKIKTAAQDGWISVSVADDGCGMGPAFVRDSLFRPFKTTKKKGLGIGMFQAKMIVQAHGGKIRVQSDAGKGTTFHVLLPVRAKVP